MFKVYEQNGIYVPSSYCFSLAGLRLDELLLRLSIEASWNE